MRRGRGVELDKRRVRPLHRRDRGGLLGLLEQLVEAAAQVRGGVRTVEGVGGRRSVAALDRAGQVAQDLGERGGQCVHRLTQGAHLVSRHHRQHREADQAAHERVLEPGRRGVGARQRGDQHGRAGGLAGDEGAATQQRGDRNRRAHDQSDLHRTGADLLDHRRPHGDPDSDPHHHLEGTADSPARDDAQHDR